MTATVTPAPLVILWTAVMSRNPRCHCESRIGSAAVAVVGVAPAHTIPIATAAAIERRMLTCQSQVHLGRANARMVPVRARGLAGRPRLRPTDRLGRRRAAVGVLRRQGGHPVALPGCHR